MCVHFANCTSVADTTQMYVLSSMPLNRQSIAGSLFQTLTRLCTAVGIGIATAIFEGVQKKPSHSGYYANNPAEPYAATFWFSVGISALGVLFVPLLRIGTQGHDGDKGRLDGEIDGRDELARRTGAVPTVDVEKGV